MGKVWKFLCEEMLWLVIMVIGTLSGVSTIVLSLYLPTWIGVPSLIGGILMVGVAVMSPLYMDEAKELLNKWKSYES